MMTMIPITMTSTMKMTGGILMIGLPGLLNSQMMKLQHMLLLQRLPLRLLPLKTSMAARATKEKARKASPNSLQDPSAPIVGPNFTDLRIVLWRHHLLTAHRCSVPPTIMILGQSIGKKITMAAKASSYRTRGFAPRGVQMPHRKGKGKSKGKSKSYGKSFGKKGRGKGKGRKGKGFYEYNWDDYDVGYFASPTTSVENPVSMSKLNDDDAVLTLMEGEYPYPDEGDSPGYAATGSPSSSPTTRRRQPDSAEPLRKKQIRSVIGSIYGPSASSTALVPHDSQQLPAEQRPYPSTALQ